MGSQLPDPAMHKIQAASYSCGPDARLVGWFLRIYESLNCPCSLKIYIQYIKWTEKKSTLQKSSLGMPTSRKPHLSRFSKQFLWSWWCHVVGSFEAFGHLHFRRQTPTWVSSIPFPHLCLHKEPPSQNRLGLRGKSCHGKPPASDFPGRLCRLTWTFQNSKVLFFEWKSKPKN